MQFLCIKVSLPDLVIWIIVQLAKLAGNTVVATCGGGAKAKLLKELGVDRVIDYHSEDVKTVLREEFPKGIDIIYESVGGDMLNLCLNALAVHGRLIVIGMISQYQGEKGWTPSKYPGLLEKLLAKSQTVLRSLKYPSHSGVKHFLVWLFPGAIWSLVARTS
ncbi:hypothetical protein GLYMA_07G211500v4 [Glycine max]|nr:hypothetical protein GLYMA_07G211500v4 [Glycine max]KAH1087880.1 hypothetical protein GYH30_019113 [Glycine max]